MKIVCMDGTDVCGKTSQLCDPAKHEGVGEHWPRSNTRLLEDRILEMVK